MCCSATKQSTLNDTERRGKVHGACDRLYRKKHWIRKVRSRKSLQGLGCTVLTSKSIVVVNDPGSSSIFLNCLTLIRTRQTNFKIHLAIGVRDGCIEISGDRDEEFANAWSMVSNLTHPVYGLNNLFSPVRCLWVGSHSDLQGQRPTNDNNRE